MDVYYSGTDSVITITTDADIISPSAIEFKIARDLLSDAVITKSLGSGVTLTSARTISVTLSAADTATLAGVYRCQLVVVDASNKTAIIEIEKRLIEFETIIA